MNEEQQDDWNPRDASILEDQRRAYDEMRERCPVAHSEFMGWSLFRHEDIATVLADPETYSNASGSWLSRTGWIPRFTADTVKRSLQISIRSRWRGSSHAPARSR